MKIINKYNFYLSAREFLIAGPFLHTIAICIDAVQI